MTTTASVRAVLDADAGPLQRGFRQAETAVGAYGRALSRQEAVERRYAAIQARASQEMARDMQARRDAVLSFTEGAGRAMVVFGAATLAGLGLAAKAAMDWETAWAGVTKVVDGSPEQMAALERELRQLATTLPATHEEIAGVAEAAGQLGVRREDIAGFTETMIRLGVSTNLSAEEAATGLAKLGNIMGVLPADADRAGAALVALGNSGASTEADILSMSQRIAGAGRQVGLTAAEVLAFANTLSSVGIEAEAGGSAISRVFTTIESATRAGGSALDTFARVAGVSAEEYRRAFAENAADATALFIEGLGRIQSSGGDVTAVLNELGLSELRVADTLRRTSQASDLLTDSLDTGRGAWEANSALVEESSKRFQTAESRIAMARNQLNDAAIDIGGTVLPAFAGLAEDVGTMAELFRGLPAPVQSAIGKLGLVAGVVAVIGGAALVAVPKVVALKVALEGMGTTGQRAGRAIGGLGAALTGPWGVALAAGTIALGAWMSSQIEAKQRVDDLAASLDDQTGAITDNTRATVVDALEKSGALQAAKDFGVALDDLTDAALGNQAAVDRVNAALDDHSAVAGTSAGAAAALAAQEEKVRGAVAASSGAVGEAVEQHRRQKEALGASTTATEDAATAAGGAAGEYRDLAGSVGLTSDELDQLSQALDEVNSTTLDARAAARAYEEALDAANESLKQNGASLNRSTEAGRRNEAALDAIAEAAIRQAQAILAETRSESAFRASLAQSRTSLVATAQRFGLTKAQAEAYADSVLSVPSQVSTRVNLSGDREAITRIRTLNGYLDQINGRTVRYVVDYYARPISIPGVTTARAEGGILPGPPSARDNMLIYAASGEYVVNAAATARNRALLDAINSGRRVEVQHLANGGTVQPRASGSVSLPAGDTWVVNAPTTSAADIIAAGQRAADRRAAIRGRRR